MTTVITSFTSDWVQRVISSQKILEPLVTLLKPVEVSKSWSFSEVWVTLWNVGLDTCKKRDKWVMQVYKFIKRAPYSPCLMISLSVFSYLYRAKYIMLNLFRSKSCKDQVMICHWFIIEISGVWIPKYFHCDSVIACILDVLDVNHCKFLLIKLFMWQFLFKQHWCIPGLIVHIWR